jgi:hypothetical protein
MLPLDDEGVAYALVALRKISRNSESTNFFQDNPAFFLFFKKIALPLQHSFLVSITPFVRIVMKLFFI